MSDFQGLPLPEIVIENLINKERTISDFYGFFKIKVKKGDSLKFKYSKSKCYPETYAVIKNLDSLKVNILTKEETAHQKCLNKQSRFFSFVGKRLNQKKNKNSSDCDSIIIPDFSAKFIIKEVVYGNSDKRNIDLSEFKHYTGSYKSSKNYQLFFVKEYCESYYVNTRFPANVFKTKNNRWAIPYTPDRHKRIDTSILKPKPIDFGNLSFKSRRSSFEEVKKNLVFPYYYRKGRRFYPKMGYYVEDYFAYWKSQQKDWKYSN